MPRKKDREAGKKFGYPSGMPLGGIGAGKVEFCENGKFTNVVTSNNWDVPIADGRATAGAGSTPAGIPQAFLAYWEKGGGAWGLKTDGAKWMRTVAQEQIGFHGMFPVAEVKYSGLGKCQVSLMAFSGLTLDDTEGTRYRDSSTPAAIFSFRVRNPAKKQVDCALAFSWPNLVGCGGYVGLPMNDSRYNTCEFRGGGKHAGLFFSSTNEETYPRVRGNYSLILEKAPGIEVSSVSGWDGDEKGREIWDRLNEHGSLSAVRTKNGRESINTGGIVSENKGKEGAGILCASFTLKPGQEIEVPFALGWYFPHLTAPHSKGRDYGHAYQNWYGSSWDAAVFAMENRVRLFEGVHRWHCALADSTLPDWLQERLANTIFPVYANTWYTRKWRFAVNESPTYMVGCAGTIDQRTSSNSIYSMSFPALSRDELLMFAEQQVQESHPERWGTHWNFLTGRYDLKFDRAGAIRHDVGWDDIEGGRLGGRDWATSHWPDLGPVFVLQCYELYLWTGDEGFMRRVWPNIKKALDFQLKLDQNGDGLADLWGPGCSTFDSFYFPYYGTSPFVAFLYMAALRAGKALAGKFGEGATAREYDRRLEKAALSVERLLWDPKLGYYLGWHDEMWKNWKGGPREHSEKSENCTVVQLAGQWLATMLNLGRLAENRKIDSAMGEIKRLNNASRYLCPPLEVSPNGKIANVSWPPYAETYYACNAIYEGRFSDGWKVLEGIHEAVYKVNKSPWDMPLVFDGKRKEWAGWGRWYMTTPSTWFVLPALAGICTDLVKREFVLSPNIGKPIQKNGVARIPLFMPNYWAVVEVVDRANEREVSFLVTKKTGKVAMSFDRIITDTGGGEPIALSVNGKMVVHPRVIFSPVDGRASLNHPFVIEKEGDKVSFIIRKK